MAQTHYTEWRCDRCDAVEKKADLNAYQPPSWRGLSRHNPPKSAGEFGPRIHLCGSCWADFERWLNPPQAAEAVAR